MELFGCSNSGFSYTPQYQADIVNLALWVNKNINAKNCDYKTIQSSGDASRIRMIVPFMAKAGLINPNYSHGIDLKDFFTIDGKIFVNALMSIPTTDIEGRKQKIKEFGYQQLSNLLKCEDEIYYQIVEFLLRYKSIDKVEFFIITTLKGKRTDIFDAEFDKLIGDKRSGLRNDFIITNKNVNAYNYIIRILEDLGVIYCDENKRYYLASSLPFNSIVEGFEDEQIVPVDFTTKHIAPIRLTYKGKHISKARKAIGKRDYEKIIILQIASGKRGEEFVLKCEKEKLINCGRQDLAEKVKQVSLLDDSLGYDIESFDEKGNATKIEVKSTTSNLARVRFFISLNELETYKSTPNMFIYFVWDVNSSNPKYHIIDRKTFNDDFFVPNQFLVDVDVATL